MEGVESVEEKGGGGGDGVEEAVHSLIRQIDDVVST